MDWLSLKASMGLEHADFPARTADIIALQRVLDGTQYDHLPYDFATEKTEGGEYVPLRKRRPSARGNLCRVVVDDAVSLLFGDGHMPTIQADDETTRAGLSHLMKVHAFGELMMDAATKGSVGSVAIRLRVLKKKPFFDVLTTEYLTPEWFADDPSRLQRITEKRKVKAAELAGLGYAIDPAAGEHWFQRVWDEAAETWFQPWPVSKPREFTPRVDAQRTVEHGLGFVPIIWVKNLPGNRGVDGVSTFERGVSTAIDADYLLSQGGRGLRYSSDPTLVLKGPPDEENKEGGAARALVVAPEGDAKLLEINGSAAGAVLNHYHELRVQVLEQLHGNRAHPDKMTAAQSGRAMELLNQSLVWLAGKLRTSYGEGALLQLLQMTVSASRIVKGGLLIDGKPTVLSDEGLWLKWPDWYPPTADDRKAEMDAFAQGLTHGVISRETAVQTSMAFYDMQDLQSELARIKTDQAEEDARLAKQAAQVKATETVGS